MISNSIIVRECSDLLSVIGRLLVKSKKILAAKGTEPAISIVDGRLVLTVCVEHADTLQFVWIDVFNDDFEWNDIENMLHKTRRKIASEWTNFGTTL